MKQEAMWIECSVLGARSAGHRDGQASSQLCAYDTVQAGLCQCAADRSCVSRPWNRLGTHRPSEPTTANWPFRTGHIIIFVFLNCSRARAGSGVRTIES